MHTDRPGNASGLTYLRCCVFILASFGVLIVSQWLIFRSGGDLGYAHLLLTMIFLSLTISIHPRICFLHFIVPERLLVYLKHNTTLPFILNAIFSLYLLLDNQTFLAAAAAIGILYGLYLRTKIPQFIGLVALLIILILFLKLDFTPRLAESDILPVIKAANDTMLHGSHPYLADYSHITLNQYFYLPAQSLIYLPAHLLGVPYTWINWICYLTTILLSYFFFRKDGKSDYFNMTLLPILFSYHTWRLISTAQVITYFLPVILGLLLFSQKRYLISALCLGMALSMRQTAVVFIGLLLVSHLFSKTSPRAITTLLLGAAPLVLSLSVFEYLYPGTLKLVFLDLPGRQILRAVDTGNPKLFIGLSYWIHLLFSGGHQMIQLVIGLLSSITLAWLTRMGKMTPFDTLIFTGCVYIVFISLNPYLHEYYYYPGYFLCAAALLCKTEPEDQHFS